MTHVEVIIGWTRSDPATGYSSFDGYRPGASQHTETVSVDVELATDRTMDWNVLAIADAAFGATNNPNCITDLEVQIRNAIEATGYHGEGAHYSLSVGDTVTVNEVTLACQSFGWERVTIEPPQIPSLENLQSDAYASLGVQGWRTEEERRSIIDAIKGRIPDPSVYTDADVAQATDNNAHSAVVALEECREEEPCSRS